jgi:hypothetical protein
MQCLFLKKFETVILILILKSSNYADWLI